MTQKNNEMKMDGPISDFFRENYNPNWKPEEQVEFLLELFSNLSLHVRPIFPSDETMVECVKRIMEEALKNRKIKVEIYFGEKLQGGDQQP